MSRCARQIIFFGRVQGVGFRFTALRTANRCELVGWVRNLPDGSVEMLAQGRKADIEQCLAEIKDYFSGYITEIKTDEVPTNPAYNDFRITF